VNPDANEKGPTMKTAVVLNYGQKEFESEVSAAATAVFDKLYAEKQTAARVYTLTLATCVYRARQLASARPGHGAGVKVVWRERPGAYGWTVTAAAYVDPEGSVHVGMDAVRVACPAGPSHHEEKLEAGPKAAAFVYPILAYQASDAIYEKLTPSGRHLFESVLEDPLDVLNRMVLMDDVGMDEPNLSAYDRSAVMLMLESGKDRAEELEGLIAECRKKTAERVEEEKRRLESETYDEREEREMREWIAGAKSA
jgi:hypothetical protein